MYKNFISFLASLIFPSEQLVVVVSEDLNASSASMQRYEKRGEWEKVGSAVPVVLGRSGLGYGTQKGPLKIEGDGRSPLGIFPIASTFGYDSVSDSAMPYLYADERLICVDDVNDSRYNRIITAEDPMPGSYERMRRPDGVYRYGAVIDYNPGQERGRGSCIFIHLNHPDKHPTSGCTAMDEAPLVELLQWLDPDKMPQILQIPKSECRHYQQQFEGIECE